jgi:MFS transporter, PHS family, inorganic phosphate transporter
MASVFIMQPVGQLLAAVVGLAVLLTVGRSAGLPTATSHVEAATIVDRIWRYVIGVGAIPALVAIGFRLTIPESPRFTLDVDNDGARALRDTRKYYNIQRRASNGSVVGNGYEDAEDHSAMQQLPKATLNHEESHDQDDDSMVIQELGGVDSNDQDEEEDDAELPDPFSWAELHRFFWVEGNIKYLLGTSMTWLLLDFAFYGLGINNPRVIAQIWASEPITNTTAATNTPAWANPTDPGLGVYETLKADGIRSIITVSIGSLLGSLILIKMINYVPRKAWLTWSFVGMTALFAVIGGTYFTTANSNLHALTITLYVLCQLLFNLGMLHSRHRVYTKLIV